jgi:hypothetical protein
MPRFFKTAPPPHAPPQPSAAQQMRTCAAQAYLEARTRERERRFQAQLDDFDAFLDSSHFKIEGRI